MSEYINRCCVETTVPLSMAHALVEIVRLAAVVTRYKTDAINGNSKLVFTTWVPKNKEFAQLYANELKNALTGYDSIESMYVAKPARNLMRPIVIAKISFADDVYGIAPYMEMIESPEYKKLDWVTTPTFDDGVRATKDACIAFQKGCIPILKKYGLIK